MAIELAAARIRLLPPPVLLERLRSRLTLLTGGVRDLPARQQTLRATLDWSYSLLSTGEQVLFARLAVFVGGWTLEAAEAVCNADGDLPLDLLDGLQSLLDKSLLWVEEHAHGAARFGMLETIREYAWEQLAARGEAAALQQAHARYYLALAEQAEPELKGSQQAMWLARLETEHANLRAVLQWAEEHGATELALRLGGALWGWWSMHGHLSEGRRWLAAALAQGGFEPAAVRAKALHGAASLTWLQGDTAQAMVLIEESLALRRELGDKRGIVINLEGVATAAAAQRQAERAVRLWAAAKRLRDATGTPLPPAERSRYERDLAATRAHLDAVTFTAAWAEGCAMSLEQAITCALETAVVCAEIAGPSLQPPPAPLIDQGSGDLGALKEAG